MPKERTRQKGNPSPRYSGENSICLQSPSMALPFPGPLQVILSHLLTTDSSEANPKPGAGSGFRSERSHLTPSVCGSLLPNSSTHREAVNFQPKGKNWDRSSTGLGARCGFQFHVATDHPFPLLPEVVSLSGKWREGDLHCRVQLNKS